jgi:hypothetical protein
MVSNEVQSFVLPNPNLVVTYSTRKFSLGVSGPTLDPGLPVQVTWADYAAENDASLTAALGISEHRLLDRCTSRPRTEDDEILRQRQPG